MGLTIKLFYETQSALENAKPLESDLYISVTVQKGCRCKASMGKGQEEISWDGGNERRTKTQSPNTEKGQESSLTKPNIFL